MNFFLSIYKIEIQLVYRAQQCVATTELVPISTQGTYQNLPHASPQELNIASYLLHHLISISDILEMTPSPLAINLRQK